MYRFHVHRRVPSWRLVTLDGAAFPTDGVEADWDVTRLRTSEDTNPEVRAEVDANGFCLFRLGGAFADIEA